MKPFRLSKNHISTGVFNNANDEEQNNLANRVPEIPNIPIENSENNNVIRINPLRLSEIRGNIENEEEILNLNNNLDME